MRFFALVVMASMAGSVVACSASDGDVDDSQDELRVDRGDHPWIYAGPLPALERPEVFISLDIAARR